ncbi:uncharacterized protein TM35_000171890 [Trypanosoma theileri]|uniref:Uncharacterized protein n=1 Tax=Trypanosoma theileri TaxID=67003 RepID=A0A1X0NUC5_9TRYP|nr:uncharacterized protein TM35_000171890 [Trypanosoma theileri]ORC88317.1 hypothetical protein TM35_000171890 [Trypanosoma theileri]
MAALRSVLSRQQVSGFCDVGSSLLQPPACLSHSVWEAALDRIEQARHDKSILPSLSSLYVQSFSRAVRHYHDLYTRCAQLLVMPLSRWEQWREGLFFFMSAAKEKESEEKTTLTGLCTQLMQLQQQQFVVVFWGCWSSVALRLESLLTRLPLLSANEEEEKEKEVLNSSESVSLAPSHDDDDDEMKEGVVDRKIVRLRRRYFSIFYQFQQLAHDASHLFGSYTKVGKAERQWLSECLMLGNDGDNDNDNFNGSEEAAEAFIRRSFKRDFSVPSLDLITGELVEEYNDFEVNESKKKAMEKKAQETIKSMWCTEARKMFELELEHSEVSMEKPMPDLARNELLDTLLQCLCRKVGKPELALAVIMRDLLEDTLFPAVLNISQLERALTVLLQWFEAYTAERNHGEIPLFTNEDLWSFVLERHTELLKWVVFHYCQDEDGKRNLTLAVEGVKTVSFSLLRCLDVYMTTIAGRRSLKDAKEERKDEVKQKVVVWIQQTAVNTFLDGLSHLSSQSTSTTTTSCSSSSSFLLITTQITLLKAQLLLLADASLLAMDVRQLLFPTLDPAFKEMQLVREAKSETELIPWTLCIVSILKSLTRTLQYTSKGTESAAELVSALHIHYKTLQGLSPSSLVDLVSNEWVDFLSAEGRHSLGSRKVTLLDVTHSRRVLLDSHENRETETVDVQRKRPREE